MGCNLLALASLQLAFYIKGPCIYLAFFREVYIARLDGHQGGDYNIVYQAYNLSPKTEAGARGKISPPFLYHTLVMHHLTWTTELCCIRHSIIKCLTPTRGITK